MAYLRFKPSYTNLQTLPLKPKGFACGSRWFKGSLLLSYQKTESKKEVLEIEDF